MFRLAGDALHFGSIAILLWRMLWRRSCAGISLKTEVLYALVLLTRYVDVLFAYSSLFDKVIKLLSILLTLHTIFLMRAGFNTTYDKPHDTFKIVFLIAPAALLTVLVNPLSFHTHPLRTCYKFSMFLDTTALLPQLFLLQRTAQSPLLTPLYLCFLAGYRMAYTGQHLMDLLTGTASFSVILSHLLAVIVFLDFAYQYLTKVYWSKEVALPH
eukprot:NODE_3571_length_943_cov_230.622549_g3419_i0.p1 GENE.NODE_3571_length_943_cov_230.622549_g3419_i0~~NODE_3571_length_943_cov_230.622549_g3419_i0.p1  ORF type:complete len:213 (+),score=53.95 NODE_3571_length_943_cov_230.622549_g3419_i0:57-695(+)